MSKRKHDQQQNDRDENVDASTRTYVFGPKADLVFGANDGGTVQVHTSIVQQRSPVLGLFHTFDEPIPLDISFELLVAFFSVLYDDDPVSNMPLDLMPQILVLAHKYDMPFVEYICRTVGLNALPITVCLWEKESYSCPTHKRMNESWVLMRF